MANRSRKFAANVACQTRRTTARRPNKPVASVGYSSPGGHGKKNRRLKRIYADLSLKQKTLKDIVEKNCETSREARAEQLRQAASSANTYLSMRDVGHQLSPMPLSEEEKPRYIVRRADPVGYRG